MIVNQWNLVSTVKPPNNLVVETKIDDAQGQRNSVNLRFHDTLWWHADNGMYVYYQPTHWRYIS